MQTLRVPFRTHVFTCFLFLLLQVDGSGHVTRWRRSQVVLNRHSHRHHHVHHWGPFFEETQAAPDASLAAVVPLGGAVDLNCRVAMLHDKTVMWIRRTSELVTLITVGNSLYSNDPRMAIQFQYPSNWQLKIRNAEKGDEGQYICQVSTHPPRVLITNLTVLAPELKIVDEHGHSVHDRYYKTGSTIELACKVMTSTETGKVIWSKDNHPLDHKVKTIRGSEKDVGRLVIARADKRDSGAYSCAINKNSSVVVHVTVLNGETQAAVQQDTWNGVAKASQTLSLFLFLATMALQH